MTSDQRQRQSIGFIGLGNLGRPMAENLLAAGFPLRVYNRTAEKARPLVERGASLADAPHLVAEAGGVVLSCLADDRAVEAAAGDDLARALGPGGVHVSMSTILPATAERLAEGHARFGATYVAAPVFGRPEAAAARKLWVCTSGPGDAKARVRPVLDALGQGVFDFGDAAGAAHVVKVAGNLLIHSAIEALAEVGAFAEKSGVPRAALFDMLTATLFNSPVYHNYAAKLKAATWSQVGFALPLALKDTNLALKTGEATHTPLPLAGLLRDRFLAALAKGRGELDATAFALGAAEDAGLEWNG